MRSADAIVARRCATTTMEHAVPSSATCTSSSDRASSAEDGSSRTITSGFRTSARAMATRCRWPPDWKQPPSPTAVSRPSGSCDANSATPARRAASSTHAREARGSEASRPKRMFSASVPEKSCGSCSTYATLDARSACRRSRTSMPSKVTRPPVGS
mmetsp:Transcript_15639/g.52703  ORF Transcript_15639/g.52703 Transcript_15639/m.52703 type:complete len:157 (+) Transcript_15639:288-758(+)